MNIFEYFKKKGIDTIDPSFYRTIEKWNSWYRGNVRNFSTYKVYCGKGVSTRCHRHSLGMAKKVCEDLADLLLNERVRFTVGSRDESGNVQDAVSNSTYDYLKRVLNENNFRTLGNEYQERKAALGTVSYLPYLANAIIDGDGNVLRGDVKINYVIAPDIFPISWENGDVREAAFVFPRTVLGKKYAQIQFHRLRGGQYVIENTVVECTKGAGTELSPEEWKKIPAFENLAVETETGSSEPQFVIDKLALVNNADEDPTNPMGVAIFANAIDILKKIDLEYDSYVNEFVLGKKRVFVREEMLSDANGNLAFDPDDTVFYRLPEDDTTEAGFIKESNMAIRSESHSRAISDDLNYLSAKCGFGNQRYRFINDSETATATEIISENSDMFRTLVKHELVLDSVLKKLFRIILRLGQVAGEKGLDPNAAITIDFDDSIIEDKQFERESDRKDVAIGVMGLAEYRAKWYGETEDAAKKRLPEQTGVLP